MGQGMTDVAYYDKFIHSGRWSIYYLLNTIITRFCNYTIDFDKLKYNLGEINAFI